MPISRSIRPIVPQLARLIELLHGSTKIANLVIKTKINYYNEVKLKLKTSLGKISAINLENRNTSCE